MIGNQDFIAAAQVASPVFAMDPPMSGTVAKSVDSLRDAGCVETAELVGRLADRLMRQEQMLREERARSADLELKLSLALASSSRANAALLG